MEPAPSRAWARRQVVERLSLQKCRRLLTESRSELGARLDIQTAAGAVVHGVGVKCRNATMYPTVCRFY